MHKSPQVVADKRPLGMPPSVCNENSKRDDAEVPLVNKLLIIQVFLYNYIQHTQC